MVAPPPGSVEVKVDVSRDVATAVSGLVVGDVLPVGNQLVNVKLTAVVDAIMDGLVLGAAQNLNPAGDEHETAEKHDAGVTYSWLPRWKR